MPTIVSHYVDQDSETFSVQPDESWHEIWGVTIKRATEEDDALLLAAEPIPTFGRGIIPKDYERRGAFLSILSITLPDHHESGGDPLFPKSALAKGNAPTLIREMKFDACWKSLPEKRREEIMELVYQVNSHWRPQHASQG